MQHQQPLGDVDTTIGVDPDQVVVEGGMMDFESAMPLASTGWPSSSCASAMMWGRIQQTIIRQIADRTPIIVGGKHAVSEGGLMQPLLDQAESVAALDRVRGCPRGSSTRELAERDPRAQAMSVPVHDECGDDGLVEPGRDAKEVDQWDLLLGRLTEPCIVRSRRISAHEGVVELLVAGEDLLVHAALIIVQDAPALPRKHSPDAQQKGHPAWFEDPALGVPKGQR